MHLFHNRRFRVVVAIAGAAMALLVAVGGLPTPGSVAAQETGPGVLAMRRRRSTARQAPPTPPRGSKS